VSVAQSQSFTDCLFAECGTMISFILRSARRSDVHTVKGFRPSRSRVAAVFNGAPALTFVRLPLKERFAFRSAVAKPRHHNTASVSGPNSACIVSTRMKAYGRPNSDLSLRYCRRSARFFDSKIDCWSRRDATPLPNGLDIIAASRLLESALTGSDFWRGIKATLRKGNPSGAAIASSGVVG